MEQNDIQDISYSYSQYWNIISRKSHGNNLKDKINVCIIARTVIVRYYNFRDMIVVILTVYM